MILEHEWIKRKAWVLNIPTWLSEIFETDDIKRLITNIQKGDESYFMNNLKIAFSEMNRNWSSKMLSWEDLYRIFIWLIHVFETQIKLNITDLSVSQKIFAILTWTLKEKKDQINATKNILQRCKLLTRFFSQCVDKKFSSQEILSLLSEHLEELKKSVYSRDKKQWKWHIIWVDNNVIYAKFD